MLKVLVATFLSFTTFVVVHWLHFHFINPVDRINWMLATASLGAGLCLALYYFLPSTDVMEKWLGKKLRHAPKLLPIAVGLLIYTLLFNSYLIFYFTADRSITFRMLRLTDERPTQAITADEMIKIYDTNFIITRRFGDLVYGGYMKQDGDVYSLTTKGKFTLGIYRFTIDFLHSPAH